jgi:hypothetical protein
MKNKKREREENDEKWQKCHCIEGKRTRGKNFFIIRK